MHTINLFLFTLVILQPYLLTMSDRYTVKAPKGAAIWATALSESITKCFNSLSEEIKETNNRIQHIDSKFDRLRETILAEVKQANDTAKEAMNIAVAAQASCAAMEAKVSSLEKSVFKLTVQNGGLKEDNSYLHRRSDNQDSYSRRENLVIKGVNPGGDRGDISPHVLTWGGG